jgi:hypothetical protein
MKRLPYLLTYLFLLFIISSYGNYNSELDRHSVWASTGDVSDVVDSDDTTIRDLKENIKVLQKEILDLERINGTGVGVYALVLNDNIEDLKRVRTELKVRKDELMYQESKALLRAKELVPTTSPLYAELDYIFEVLPERKAIFTVAIAGQESGFGTSKLAIECNNYFGYLYEGTSKRGCLEISSKTNERVNVCPFSFCRV